MPETGGRQEGRHDILSQIVGDELMKVIRRSKKMMKAMALTFIAFGIYGTLYPQSFGKNKVQYKDFS